jgi:hypothetical protein
MSGWPDEIVGRLFGVFLSRGLRLIFVSIKFSIKFLPSLDRATIGCRRRLSTTVLRRRYLLLGPDSFFLEGF